MQKKPNIQVLIVSFLPAWKQRKSSNAVLHHCLIVIHQYQHMSVHWDRSKMQDGTHEAKLMFHLGFLFKETWDLKTPDKFVKKFRELMVEYDLVF